LLPLLLLVCAVFAFSGCVNPGISKPCCPEDGNFPCPTYFGSGANFAEFDCNGWLTLNGSARSENHIRVAAPSWAKGLAAPADGLEGVYWTIDFSNDREESVYYTLIVPYRMELGSDIGVTICWLHDTNDVGAVTWGVEYRFTDCNDVVDGATAIITKTDGANTIAGRLVCSAFDGELLNGDPETLIGVRVFRDHDSQKDTLGEDARLVEVHFHFVRDRLGEQYTG